MSEMVTIHVDIAPKLNFACHQNAFSFLRNLQIENSESNTRLENLVVTLSSNPDFLHPQPWQLDRIEPGGIISIDDRDVKLNGDFFLNLTDSIRGDITVDIKCNDEIITKTNQPVELLTYNEWGGAGFMPELLAAFATPNDPVVDRILREASLVLRRAGRHDGIDGYQSMSRKRVWEISSAIYAAICNLGITYAMPPASFEQNGQKIRLPNQILESRVATCLDTTMLFTSTLEQAGLNPIVVLPKAHAVVGVWLQPEDLSSIIIDEAQILRKRIQLDELLLIETTCVTSKQAFSVATEVGGEAVSIEKDESFRMAIDIHRARTHKITPLGNRQGHTVSPAPSKNEPPVNYDLEPPPALPDFDDSDRRETPPETPQTRLERWQRKLLDLSARNPLLNHRSTKTSLRIICPDPALLEDKLADAAEISIRPVPPPTTQGQHEEIPWQQADDQVSREYAIDALSRKQVLVNLPKDELSKREVAIYRKTQTALQEGGANTLYLALGFLSWKRNETDERRFRAPLILLPVTLKRRSARSGIKILAHDDETRFNPTLLEMLRKDFGIDMHLDDNLPEDESGIDVNGVWNEVRQAVKDVPGFEVVEDVVLGHFSFAKYLMYKDLVNRTDALRKNRIVKHLIDTPLDPYPSKIDFADPGEIDRQCKPSELLMPLPADSSQMAVVATADRGKDFIVIGPPGTGKSQTIGNLIAHMLGKGKTVLFVSEKTAALEVVYRRLKGVGLEGFCLQLHSNKARKADVLDQLDKAWKSRQRNTTEEWKRNEASLRVLRDKLNIVVDRLHRRHRNGLSAYKAMGAKVRDEELAAKVVFSWPSADSHDEQGLNRMRETVKTLKVQAKAVRNVTTNPFQLVLKDEWSPQWEGQVVEHVGRLSRAATDMAVVCEKLIDSTGIDVQDRALTRLKALSDLASVLKDSWREPAIAYALGRNGSERIGYFKEAVERLEAYKNAQANLSCSYDPFAWRKLDGSEIGRQWEEANARWWLKKLIDRRRVIKGMKAGGARGKPTPGRDAHALTLLREAGRAIDRLDQNLSGIHGWDAHTTDLEVARNLLVSGKKVRSAINELVGDSSERKENYKIIKELLTEGNDSLAPDEAMGQAAQKSLESYREFQDACQEFDVIAGGKVQEHFQQNVDALTAIQKAADKIVSGRSDLRDWCTWRRRRQEAMDLALGPLVKALEEGTILLDDLETAFESAYCAWWSSLMIGEDDVLQTLSIPEHVNNIDRFREIDGKFQQLTAEYIKARLTKDLPDSNSIDLPGDWRILRREIQRQRGHKPVRQLAEQIPRVLTTLCPCLMMSPLSVAQYLPPNQELFDVVIFDEASQITVWDAVGSLARGHQAIVAGDPKQMPPTNFFTRTDDDPDGDIDIEGDLESILDEMKGAGIPEKILNLHYRSRKESLIAFSNDRYYNNSLTTFPAPVHPDKGVQLERPTGFYDRGASQRNESEAQEIVKEIIRRLTNEDPEVRKQTIGVVTFNSKQQSLILDLLDIERNKNPSIEWAFSTDSDIEPVMVKNLETVQGDERDVILFSVTYGPDRNGQVSLNLGPLNREGGERRLNVAMTRARSEMIVFSTLEPSHIDLSRTQARAIKDLKHFLMYAEHGPSALGNPRDGSIGDFESPFEAAVAQALRDKGWDIHPQVGVSAYRIDLGVVHPDAPGVYLAGVECDGAMYHSSVVARERDKIRQSVLEGLGWTLFRVWSTDWWTNKSRAVTTLNEKLTQILKEDRGKRDSVKPS